MDTPPPIQPNLPPYAVPSPTPTPTPAAPPTPPTEFEQQHTLSKGHRWFKRSAIGLAILLALFFITSVGAEMGFLPWLGVEKIYGKTALAGLWGGIPADNSRALALLIDHPINLPENFSSTFSLDYSGDYHSTQTSLTDASVANATNIFSGKASFNTTSLNHYETAQIAAELNHNDDTRENSYTLGTDIVLKDHILYLKIPDVSGQPDLATLLAKIGLDVSSAGQYLKIPIKEQDWNNFQQSIAVTNRDGLGKLIDQYDDREIQAVLDAVAPYLKRHGIERKNGHPTTHYSIDLNQDSLTKLILTIEQTPAKPDSPLPTADQLNQYASMLGKLNLQYEFWVQHRTYLVTASNLSFSLTSPDVDLELGLSSSSKTINPDSVTINVPSEDQLVGSKLVDTTASGRDAQRKSDLATIGTYLETYSAQTGSYPISTDPISLDSFDLSTWQAVGLSLPTNGPNGSDDDYFYQSNADGSAYQLTTTIEGCDETGCSYTYPESATITTTDDLATPAGRDTQRKTDLAIIANALKNYYRANSSFPTSPNAIKLSDPASSVVKSLVPAYLQALPPDPQSELYYGYKSDGKTAYLTSVIEDDTQTSCAKVASYCVYTVTVTP